MFRTRTTCRQHQPTLFIFGNATSLSPPIVDQKTLKQPPIAGLVVIDEQHLQLIIGTDVGFVAEALDQMMR